MGNVYKHLAGVHNKSKTEYLKMSKTIRNNAFIDEKENEVEETPPKLQFVKARPPEEAMQVNCHNCQNPLKTCSFQLALNLGLVNRQGVGLQRGVGRPAKVKPLENNGQVRGDDFVCDHCGYASISAKGLSIHMGLGKCKRTVKENLANGVVTSNGGTEGYESDDDEVSFSPRSGDLLSSSDSQPGLSPLTLS